MEDFHLSIFEYEGIRMSYVRKWVYKIHHDILYYRRLTHGRFEQDDLKQIQLNSAQLSYIQKLLSEKAFLHSTTFHCPHKEEGIQHRILLKIEEGDKSIEQEFTGEEFDLAHAQPQIEALWRRLNAWTSTEEYAAAIFPASPALAPASSLDIKWTKGKTGSLHSQHFTLRDHYLSVSSDLGQKKGIRLSPYQEKQLLTYFEEHEDTIWKTKGASKSSRSLFDQYMIFEMMLEHKAQLHQLQGEGFHFTFIEKLSFLQLEILINFLHQLISGQMLLDPQISPQQAS